MPREVIVDMARNAASSARKQKTEDLTGVTGCRDSGAIQGITAYRGRAVPNDGLPCCGFTLIELLAVVAIMAIILMAAVPIFQTLGKRDLNAVAFQLRATLRLARQAAVTQRRYVYVIFPDSRAANTPETLQYCLRSYACVSTNPISGGWEYLTEWKLLPRGVYFVREPTLTGNVFRTATPSVPFPTENAAAKVVSSVCFTPAGRALFGGTNAVTDTSIYFTTAHFYTTNDTGTALIGRDIPGATNSVRVRLKTGQVDTRGEAMY